MGKRQHGRGREQPQRSTELPRALSGAWLCWAWLGWMAPQWEGRRMRSHPHWLSSIPFLPRDHLLTAPLGHAPLTWRNRQLSKVDFPSCSVCSNSILILLQGKEGRGLWLAAAHRPPAQHDTQWGKERETGGKTAALGEKKILEAARAPERQRDEGSEKMRTSRRTSRRTRETEHPAREEASTGRGYTAAGSPWQCAHASEPCAHPHHSGPGCLPRGTCSAFAAGHPAPSVTL